MLRWRLTLPSLDTTGTPSYSFTLLRPQQKTPYPDPVSAFIHTFAFVGRYPSVTAFWGNTPYTSKPPRFVPDWITGNPAWPLAVCSQPRCPYDVAMKPAGWWRETQHRFKALIDEGGIDLSVSGPTLSGGTPTIRHQFRNVATAAGRAVGGTGETGYETWLVWLWERLKPLKDEYFSEQQVSSRRPTSREIPLSRIDSPPKKQSAERRGETRFAGLDPSERIVAVAHSGFHMVVVPGPRRRYVVAPQDRAIYAAYEELGYTSAPCVVKTRGRRLPMEEHPVDGREIDRVCCASMDLCELLETEAFAEEMASGTDIAKESKQQEMQGDRPRSVAAVGQNIERLRLEIGFSYENWLPRWAWRGRPFRRTRVDERCLTRKP